MTSRSAIPNPRKLFSASVVAIALLLAGCMTPSVDWRPAPGEGSERPGIGGIQAQCTPVFPDSKGWLGGDAAYSIAMPDPESSLWLFGDTFVENDPLVSTRSFPFIHNSIGLSRCAKGGRWSLETFWNQSDPTAPVAFFTPNSDSPWVRDAVLKTGRPPYYWPFDGFIVDHVLFVGLLRIVEAEPRGPFRLPFRVTGMDLARIDNPRDPPGQWRIRISTLSEGDNHSDSDSGNAYPGAAFVKDGRFIYAFTAFDREDGESPRALARLPIHALEHFRSDLTGELETYVRGGSWQSGFTPEDALILMSDSAS